MDMITVHVRLNARAFSLADCILS